MIQQQGKYYLYRHIRNDLNTPFYIGIGTKRINNEYVRAFTNSRRNKLWKSIVNKTTYTVDILLETDDYKFLLQKEKEFIKLYGRRDLRLGCLANMTDGGEGVTNKIVTEEVRQKIAKGQLGLTHSLERRKKISIRNMGNSYRLGKQFSEKSRRKMSVSNKAKRKVKQLTLQGELIRVYDSIKSTAKFGFIPSNVVNCCNNKRKTHKDFIWTYYD